MTSTDGPRVPGTWLHSLARVLFNESVIAAVVQPTIADMQREIVGAGANRAAVRRARWHGYVAFWTLVLAIPFAGLPASADEAPHATVGDVLRRLAVGGIMLATIIAIIAMLGARGAIITVAAGALIALMIHAWYQRHPADLPEPATSPRRPPQINFSSMEVEGNLGGLIFVVGTVLIVAIGLPSALWFVFVGIAGGCVVAWALVNWRTHHAKWNARQ